MEAFTVNQNDSDTASFVKTTGAQPGECLNSIVVVTKRGGERLNTLVLVPSTHRLDSKGLKIGLGGKTSFLPMDEALKLTQMERDSIGPVNLPHGIAIAADLSAIKGDRFFVGGGQLGKKIILNRRELEALVEKDIAGLYTPREDT